MGDTRGSAVDGVSKFGGRAGPGVTSRLIDDERGGNGSRLLIAGIGTDEGLARLLARLGGEISYQFGTLRCLYWVNDVSNLDTHHHQDD